MRYRIFYERASQNYGAYSPDLLGCVATGDSLDECRISMREAIKLHLELSRKYGDPVPPDPTAYTEILDFEPERRRRTGAPTKKNVTRARVERRQTAKR